MFHPTYLVGGFNPPEKYARQIGNHFPKQGWKSKKYLKPPSIATYKGFHNNSLHLLTTIVVRNARPPSRGLLSVIFMSPKKSRCLWRANTGAPACNFGWRDSPKKHVGSPEMFCFGRFCDVKFSISFLVSKRCLSDVFSSGSNRNSTPNKNNPKKNGGEKDALGLNTAQKERHRSNPRGVSWF